MPQKKNPASAGTLRGTGKHKPAVSGAAYHKKQHADNESIWDACREALDAAASREAQAVANLQSAALKLGGFTLNEKGDRWVTHCPHCGGKVELCSTDSGVGVVGYSPKCDGISRIDQWLRDEGFQS